MQTVNRFSTHVGAGTKIAQKFNFMKSNSVYRPTFVMLEGETAMSAKRKVMDRLRKMGHTTYTAQHFLDMPKFGKHDHVKQCNKYISEIRAFIEDAKFTQHKNDHIFIDGTPLNPLFYTSPNDQMAKIIRDHMRQILEEVEARVFVCEADEFESAYRLGVVKHNQVEENEIRTSEEFNDMYRSRFDGDKRIEAEKDIVEFIHNKYNLLTSEGWFENTLITTDGQQACCKLLEILNIQFKLPTPKYT
ncbi:hypothetical protein AKO1_006840 [Acrasis kona]|uniref:NadR/Ttd14 AAA domain-containing protein n=1 Tax=Acrasis kona TaxID=1008807 RepID=A0AAW2YUR6_9EUKA